MMMVMVAYVRHACTKCSSDKWCFSATKPIPSKDLCPLPFYACNPYHPLVLMSNYPDSLLGKLNLGFVLYQNIAFRQKL